MNKQLLLTEAAGDKSLFCKSLVDFVFLDSSLSLLLSVSLSGVADLQFLHHSSRSQLGVKRGSTDPIRFSSIKICLQVT